MMIVVTVGLSVLMIVLALLPSLAAKNTSMFFQKGSQSKKEYQLHNFKLKITVPKEYMVKEYATYTDLIKGGDKITISRTGTNFTTIEEYIDGYDLKRKLKILNQRFTAVNGLPAVVREEELIGGPVFREKLYAFYKDFVVYTVSTSSNSLYSDLDRIAQSIRLLNK